MGHWQHEIINCVCVCARTCSFIAAGSWMFTPACCRGGEVQHLSTTPLCMVTVWQESLSCRSALTGKQREILCVLPVSSSILTKTNCLHIPGLMWAPFSTRSSIRSLKTVLLMSLELFWPLREHIWWDAETSGTRWLPYPLTNMMVTYLLYLFSKPQLIDTLATLSERMANKTEQSQTGATFGT